MKNWREKGTKKGNENPNPIYPSLNSINGILQQPKTKKLNEKTKSLKLICCLCNSRTKP